LQKSKIYIILMSALLIFIPACSTNEDTSSQNNSDEETSQQIEKVEFVISKDKGEEIVEEKDVEIKKDDILLDVLEENFDVETDEDGSFITEIEGIKAENGEQKAWIYSVNDEMGTVGADEYKLQPDDKVELDFQEWE